MNILRHAEKFFEKICRPMLTYTDEYHRGSAYERSSWYEILDYFDSAIQVGMTATPIEIDHISNIEYCGELIYTYSLKHEIDDGFLAPVLLQRHGRFLKRHSAIL